jgi:negative regulator of sigma E activity
VSQDLEQDLREALRPVEPAPEFTNRLLAKIATARRGAASNRRPWLRQMAVAASLVLALGLGWRTYQQRERALQAHAELLKALAITSRSLDHAYQAVHSLDADRVHGG